MKQLLILSGKGGTGKTTVASAFIKIANAKMYADCDVDAPNLHLLMNWSIKPQQTDFFGMSKAEIDLTLCAQCDLCRQNCRFDAINKNDLYKIDPYACEGCGVCQIVCPAGAISLKPSVAGELKLYHDRAIFSTAQLKMGSGTSGKLVAEVKKQLMKQDFEAELAIIDGSPGIGCPVIASLSGVDMVLIITEPSVSGISDMERIIKTAKIFGNKITVCINKYNTNYTQSENIENYCKNENIPLLGKIPFDPIAVNAVNMGKSIVEVECKAGAAVKDVFDKTISCLFEEG